MSGRDVIVTGGTGALGRAVVRAFLADGDRVVVPWVVEAEAQALSEGERDAVREGRLQLVEADVAEERGAAAVAQAAGPALGALVNGVGGFGGGAPLAETDLELWDRLWRLNVRTAVAVSRAALPKLAVHGGAIVNVASQAALDCPAGIAAYVAAKAGVVALTRSLPANRAAMPDADFSAWTPPERIAEVVHWLAGTAASSVRGGVIPV
jgi:NAD(P)-dependent dehydrogenase (short-subunit alcohol dehydrogenase family)